MRSLLLPFLLLASASLSAQDLLEQDFYGNGRLHSTRYAVGSVVHFVTFHENGRVMEMGGFRNGRPDGEWKQFDERGRMLVKAVFNEGHRQGTWQFWSTSGGRRGRLQFANGDLWHGEQYDAQGMLVAQRDYR